MPLVAHNDLPTFQVLKDRGQTVLSLGRAHEQDIRELHIGFLNMMPDAALAATERQFIRMVGSSNANLFASISAGIGALWGPLHGGANEACVNMLERIVADGGNVKKYVDMAKDKENGFRLMGFGHRVYKNFDPRAQIIRASCDKLLAKLDLHDPLFDVAQELQDVALEDEYFIERKLYPNVDFYSGIIYRAMGIPTEMFTVLFALGRIPGWIAHWKEMMEAPDVRIGRPRQIYMGATARDYVPRETRRPPP